MVGGLALALKELGVKVSGTDPVGFPPMPGILERAGIKVTPHGQNGRLPSHVNAVVTGSMVNRGEPLLESALKRGLPVWNAAAFLQHHFLRATDNLVVAGTKGKTSTTAMLLWILLAAGKPPSFLLGGGIRGREQRVSLSRSKVFVLEGDEYPCGLGDPLPKFLRYHPRHLGLTTLQQDHLEVYPTPDAYRQAFVHLVHQVPGNGSITINTDDPGVATLAGLTPTPITSVGFAKGADIRIEEFHETASGITFRLGTVPFALSLPGKMNARNAALATVMAQHAGVTPKKAAQALRTFPGVEGRLDLVAQGMRSRIYTDEAYHPLALRATLDALRSRHPSRRIVLLFEPRYTGGARGPWIQALPGSVAASANLVIASPPVELHSYARPFSTTGFCRRLRTLGVQAVAAPSLPAMEASIRRWCQPGDVVVISFSMIRQDETAHLTRVLREVLEIRDEHGTLPT
ncbi:UDP-N-acetylmuramate: L-alanyl-gamma-D-glutamyl-meso-diaminopimelate ligase [Roseimicrobium gellanilyticum]|uniref:UDP-N-acetylmuramate: L-alanyl-gamma-D-glutamyl-meso-diaminopimelate ligase n=2 Tax=Roseimicrobium gellanilyticum TaxID=748857 RepID=A0A366HL77_9BACT|nr:UDP-N-acetylmuramate: L-alanyl-gamma-D-glutamyl-meso-diaminopimelate ligase [Roseimicrobium gellanilyticum]